LRVLSISLANPAEVLLAIVFVVVAFAAFIGTLVMAIAYVYSNVFEKWPEYTAKKRLQVTRNILVTLAVIATLFWLASNR
jgi:uncharacterized membrane protein